MYYTGIGSRRTPIDILKTMIAIGKELGDAGWTLRSGKADGADSAFQIGMQQSIYASAEIYLPWKGFNKHNGDNPHMTPLDDWDLVVGDDKVARCFAREMHPAWYNCTMGAKALHTRNVFQILGKDLDTPSRFVIYWARECDGMVKGGTATAVALARKHNIPCINMFLPNWMERYKHLSS